METLQEAELNRVPESIRKALDDTKAKHGDAYLLEAAGVTVVCRPPTRMIYRRFRAERADPSKKAGAFEVLFLSCLVYPEPVVFDSTLDRMPALADSFGVALWDKVSGAEDASVKKV